MKTATFKKRFPTTKEATEQVFKFRRHGIDAVRRGAVCTAFLDSLTTPNYNFLTVFASDWIMV